MNHAVSSFFRDLSVGMRLFLLMGLGVLAVAVAAAAFAVADLRTQAALERHAALVRVLDLSQEAQTGIARLRAAETAFLLRGDRDSADTYAKQSARLLAVFETLGNFRETGAIRQAIDTLHDGVAEHAGQFDKIADLEGDGPSARLAKQKATTAAAAAAVEAPLLEPGREALAATMLALDLNVRRALAGDPQGAVDMVRARNEGFDRALARAGLGAAETAQMTELMNTYFSAVLDEVAGHETQQKAAARMDEILRYMRPSLDALVAFRREAEATIGETVEERRKARVWMYGGVAGAASIFVLLGSLLALGISRPLNSLAFAGRQLSDGNHQVFIPGTTVGNEVGDLARALRAVRDQQDRTSSLRGHVTQGAQLDEIEVSARDAVETIAAAAAELRRLAEAADDGMAELGHQASDITTASGETTASLRRLAAVASELHAAVAETQRDLATVGTADAINDIQAPANDDEQGETLAILALRTRMMALNSVIGAARAANGSCGPTISEVATEIDRLSRRIAEKSTTLEARETEQSSADTRLDELVQSMRDHGTATRDILRNAEGAVAAAMSLTDAISRITRTAGETGQVAATMRSTASAAAERSEQLRHNIDAILARLHL